MDLYIAGFAILVSVVSIGLSAYLIKTSKQTRVNGQTQELKDFLADLGRGDGLVRVTRVDPSDVLLRSPRSTRK